MNDYTPSGRMRWARRTIRPNPDADIGVDRIVDILQQEFCKATASGPIYEWRDVPTEDE